jgi:hypothetical protein
MYTHHDLGCNNVSMHEYDGHLLYHPERGAIESTGNIRSLVLLEWRGPSDSTRGGRYIELEWEDVQPPPSPSLAEIKLPS